MTGKELFEADMNRYHALKGRSWDTGLSEQNRKDYDAWAIAATAAKLSPAQCLDRIVDPARHKAWVEHEFPSLKGK